MSASDEREALDSFLRELVESGVAEEDALALLADAVTPVEPPDTLRAQLLETIGRGGRLERFGASVARILDIGLDRARELLDGIDRAASFTPGPLPSLEGYDVTGGPAVAGAIAGFVRMKPGSEFPLHVHVGREHVLVVSGALRDSAGRTLGPGDELVMEPGTEHSFDVLPGADLVYLVVIEKGIEVGGRLIGPDEILISTPPTLARSRLLRAWE